MKLSNEQLIQIFCAYPFAKVKVINDTIIQENCILQLRSLESIKESEAREFFKEFEDYYCVYGSAATKNRAIKYLGDLYKGQHNDWLRAHNFITDVGGIDLLKAGIAEINNEIYE